MRASGLWRARPCLTALLSATMTLPLFGSVPAHGAQEFCNGKPVTQVGTENAEVLEGTPEADVIAGLGGDDLILGLEGNDDLCGDDGSDRLSGGPGNDAMTGGMVTDPGTDTASYVAASDAVSVDLSVGSASGGDDTDTLSEIENVIGTPYNDVLTGDGKDNLFFGLGGEDYFDGGNDGNDLVSYRLIERDCSTNPLGVIVVLQGGTAEGEGSDTLVNIDSLDGTNCRDIFFGDSGDNVMFGNEGQDELWGRSGVDTLLGGPGNDRLFGGGGGQDTASFVDASGSVVADIGRERTSSEGDAGEDVMLGIERLFGSHFDDMLVGDIGDNVFSGGGGNDEMRGKGGLDLADYWVTTTPQTSSDGSQVITFTVDSGPVTANLAQGRAFNEADGQAGDGAGDSLVSIEGLWGSERNDIIRGSAKANYFVGDAGDDRIYGRGDDDYFDGGPGVDNLIGGPGALDIADYVFYETPVVADLEKGSATVGDEADKLVTIESIGGSKLDDKLVGDGGSNYLLGENGADRLLGRSGRDTLNGGPKADRVNGGPGFDHCLDRPRANCEASGLPRRLQDELERLRHHRLRHHRPRLRHH
jgi:Ca2+-binding RTX toxin-like protein